ncbi:MAG: class I SAM-dependent methyltransferase [Planctomycetes bacterium]|nr:class I SAM-dependent methyltransferase [Planctomycetota bacterium]
MTTENAAKAWWLDYYRNWAAEAEASLDDPAAAAEAGFLASALKLPARACVLDVGCGYGRHVVHLAARGYSVTGVDASPELLRRAGDAVERCGLRVNLVQADMRELPFTGEFDAAVFLGGTFGSLGDEGDRSALAAAARGLKSGGRVLIDIANVWYDTAQMVNADNRFVDWSVRDGAYRLVEATFDAVSCMGTFAVTRIGRDGTRQTRQQWRGYTYPELCGLLADVGLTAEQAWGGLDGSEFVLCSPRMVVLAAKGQP